MENIHRSEALDKLIGKRVEIEFYDNETAVGILGWNEDRGRYSMSGCEYYDDTGNPMMVNTGEILFRKSHVKRFTRR